MLVAKSPMAPCRDKVAVSGCPAGREIRTRHGVASLRCVTGPVANELFLSCVPADGTASAGRQAESTYQTMREALASEGLGPDALVSETVYFRRIREDRAAVLQARDRVLGTGEGRRSRSSMTTIGQPPLGVAADLEIAAVAVAPHSKESGDTAEVRCELSCACPHCKQGAAARVVYVGEESHFRAHDIHGAGRGTFEQAYDMFRVADELLQATGMTFRDVIRTWIYLRDIDREYAALNEARRSFFEDCGIERRPASTGVQGIPFPDAHDVAMSLYAMKGRRPLDVTLMSTPTLNEAWTYGAEFSRGLRLVDANKVTLFVSGTASIDEEGRTVHAGDLEAQAERMLRNIETLLAAHGAGFRDLVSAVTYVKRPSDAEALRTRLRARGLTGFPHSFVEAPLCRPELLCETEAVAMLPLSAKGV